MNGGTLLCIHFVVIGSVHNELKEKQQNSNCVVELRKWRQNFQIKFGIAPANVVIWQKSSCDTVNMDVSRTASLRQFCLHWIHGAVISSNRINEFTSATQICSGSAKTTSSFGNWHVNTILLIRLPKKAIVPLLHIPRVNNSRVMGWKHY